MAGAGVGGPGRDGWDACDNDRAVQGVRDNDREGRGASNDARDGIKIVRGLVEGGEESEGEGEGSDCDGVAA